MKIVIKLTSDYTVFKFGDYVGNMQIYKILEMLGLDGLSFWAPCRSPRGSFHMHINHLSMPIIWWFAYRAQDSTRRNNYLNINEIVEKMCKLPCLESGVLMFIRRFKKHGWTPCRSQEGSFDMRINYLSMPIRIEHAYRAYDNTRRNNCSNINEIGEKLCKLQYVEVHTFLKKSWFGLR